MKRTTLALCLSILLLGACTGENPSPLPEPTPAPPSPTHPPTPRPTTTPIPPTTTPLPPEQVAVLVEQNLPYVSGGDYKQKLDLYRPEGAEGTLPTIIAFHGGGGDKAELASVARYFAQRGYAVVSVNRRDYPAVHYPVPVQDAYCALAWIYANAPTYGLDPERIVGLGHSSGGSLVALMGTMDDPARFLENCPHTLPEGPPLRAVVTYTGIFDYVDAAQSSTNMHDYVVEYLEGEPDEIPERWAEASPASWLDGSEPPFLLIHGEKDQSVSPGNSERFAAALEQNGIGFELWIIPGGDHMAIIRDPETFDRIKAFLETHLD